MQFAPKKRRRSPPSIIIISLIDVLLVVLIFLMVTTTFKQQPSIKLALPESSQATQGSSEGLLVLTVTKEGPLLLNQEQIPIGQLQKRLEEAVRQNPKVVLSIRADQNTPFGQIVKVMDASKAAKITAVNAFTKPAP